MDSLEQLKDFDALFLACVEIGNIQEGMSFAGQEVLYNAEGLGKKILDHIMTARYLLKPMQQAQFERKVDFSSMAVLTRSAFETYLIFYYLFIAPVNEDEKEFRLQSWRLGGLDRVKYKPAFNHTLDKWEKEISMAEEIREKIKATTTFQQLTDEDQKIVLKGKLLTRGWHKLAVDAGFTEQFFRQQYMYLSSYAHSNRLSVIQIQQVKTLDEQLEMGVSFIGILTVVLAKFMYDYVQAMPVLKAKIDLDSEKYALVMEYKLIGEMLGDFEITEEK